MREFHYILFRLTAVLLLVTAGLATDSMGGSTTKYYCGKTPFSEEAVQSAINTDLENIYNPKTYPIPYDGDIKYATTDYLMMFPIMKSGRISDMSIEKHKNGYFVVLGCSAGIVDIITRGQDNHDRPCLKLAEAPPSASPSTLPPSTSGNHETYDCGQKYFSHAILALNVKLAELYISQLPQGYYLPYNGPLCEEHLQCKLWSIYQGNPIGSSANDGRRLKYWILIDQNFKLKSVVFSDRRTLNKCVRLKDGMPASYVERDNGVKHGYICGLDYFGIEYLNQNINKLKATSGKHKYTSFYRGPEFGSEVVLTPIHPKIESRRSAPPVNHLLVTDNNYKLICAALNSVPIKCCPPRSRDQRIVEESDNFKCQDAFISNSLMVETRNQIYSYKPTTPKTKFPAEYKGPVFDVPGPYYTWPLFLHPQKKFGVNHWAPGLLRIVINADYKLAGVLAALPMKDGERMFSKCQRDDGTTPGEGLSTPGWNPKDGITERALGITAKKHSRFSSQQ